MDLWYAPTSPFARKVRIAACELDLDPRLTLVEVNPWSDARLRALNPLAKVPTLVADDGTVLYESGVICEYLDALSGRPRLFPTLGAPRWRALLLQGLADGAMTAAGRRFADEHRPEGQRSEAMMARFAEAMAAALDTLEGEPPSTETITIGEISVAAFLGYLDFRWPDRDWRGGRPRLTAWFSQMEARRSLAETWHAVLG